MAYIAAVSELDDFIRDSNVQTTLVGAFWKEYKTAFGYSYHQALEGYAKRNPGVKVAYVNELSEETCFETLQRLNVNSTLDMTMWGKSKGGQNVIYVVKPSMTNSFRPSDWYTSSSKEKDKFFNEAIEQAFTGGNHEEHSEL